MSMTSGDLYLQYPQWSNTMNTTSVFLNPSYTYQPVWNQAPAIEEPVSGPEDELAWLSRRVTEITDLFAAA